MKNQELLKSSTAIEKATSKIRSFIDQIVDGESFVETDVFVTGKQFDSALDALGEGVVTGYATIGGRPVHLFAQNAEVLKGSMSRAHATKIIKAMKRAVASGTPFLSIIDSCGARVGEGAGVMEGYADVLAESFRLAQEVPHFCIVKGTAVGMMATYVAGADFAFMSSDAVMSVNSPMYLAAQTKAMPVDYKKLLGVGAYKNTDMVQFSYKNAKDLAEQLHRLMDMILPNEEDDSDDDANRVDPKLESYKNADQRVASICDLDQVVPYCDGYANDTYCAIGKINGITVGVLATQGEYMSEAGMDKAICFVNKLEAFGLPLVTLVDTNGINPTLEQECAGIAKKANELMQTIALAEIEKIGVAVGNAVGFGYTALMSKGMGFGYTMATSDAVVSPIAGTTAVNALMDEQLKKAKDVDKTRATLEKEYAKMQANPMVAAQEGYLDNVIEATNLRPYIASALLMLLGI